MKYTVVETPAAMRGGVYPEDADKFSLLGENGQYYEAKFQTAKRAQDVADSLVSDGIDEELFNLFFDDDTQIDYFGPNTAKRETVISELEDEIGLEGKYEVGQEVLIGGVSYIVSEVLYIDDEDADEMHDVRAGWNANARRKR